MIKEIGIRNFVLIEDLRLTFDAGLNVLTGETGAGKSILLDALGLLTGDRFRSETVRQGTDHSEIDGIFDVPKTRAFRRWWEARDFEKAEELIIRREGYPDGRSRAFLNDRPVTLGTLQELGSFLVDVHGQNEHQQVLQPSVQLELLDRFAGLEASVDVLEPLYQTWKQLTGELNAGQLSDQERLQRLDLYQFQLNEIDQAKLTIGEDETLAQRLPELKNAEKLRGLAQTAYGTLYEQEGSALERLGQAQKVFESLRTLAPSVEPLLSELMEATSRLEDTAHRLQGLSERWEADPTALEHALSRLDLIQRLQKKYGGTVEAILRRAETLRLEVSRLENSEATRQDLEKQVLLAQNELEQACRERSARRQATARELGRVVQKQLADLGLKQAIFRCVLEEIPLSSTGIDRVVFEWAPNPGEGIQPLKAIASGGEMSRVMLALKTTLAEADAIPTLVFDEVDAGVGGVTAQAVGKKLRTLSRHHQILCVSHLPQIASCAHAHFQITKRVRQGRTYADVARLESAERLRELARLLGSQVTPISVQHAEEMLVKNQ